jgi:DNA-binding transcriptional LysR family regulator
MNIMHSNLRRLDLNLLLVFDALFRHRSVAAAADELAMSPSACSHALSRMREALADELFVRAGNAMQPTVQAELMAGGVADALRILADRLSTVAPFSPENSTQTFVFAATDYTAYALLPSLVARLEQVAPHLCLKMIHASHRDSLDELRAGRIHFALGVTHGHAPLPEGIEALDYLSDDYVVVARQGHTRIGTSLSLQAYLAERHIAVLPWEDASSVIDSALARVGLQRNVAVQLPSLMAAPFIVAQSDYLFTLPRLAALQLSHAAALVMHAVPFEAPRYTLRILHHVRHSNTPGHLWMREQMLLALGG